MIDGFTILILASGWTGLAWLCGWKAHELFKCKLHHEITLYDRFVEQVPSRDLPHPAEIARLEMERYIRELTQDL